MNSTLPRLRRDLIVQRRPTQSGEVAVVKDPASGEYFRFGAVEYFLLQQCDGKTTLSEARTRTEARFNATLSDDTLTLFLAALERSGLLHSATRPRNGQAVRPGRMRGSLLYLRYFLFDPTRLLDWLLRWTRLCRTPVFLVASAVLILLATAVFVLQWSSFAVGFSRLYQFASIPLFIGVVFLLIMAHEIAHGLACRHFGGEVREIGFMLIYFQPALYCNVSDAWLFPERSRRLLVGLAGPWFELMLWALAVLAWAVTAVETWINYLALIVVTSSGVKTLLNFNPLIKLDGYYLLSDLLDIPNLRKKAFRYVGDALKRCSGWGHWSDVMVTARERRIFLAYGLLATIYSFSLLGWVTFEVSGFLIEQGQPMALALVAGLVSTRTANRVRRLMGGHSADDDDPSEPTGSGKSSGRNGKHKHKVRPRPARRWVVVGLAAIAILWILFGRWELRVAGAVNVLPEENVDVRAEVEGMIEAVLVDEGDVVEANQIVARLSGQAVLAELHTTEAAIRETQANLRKLETGATPAEMEVARAVVAGAIERAQQARTRLARVNLLLQQQAITRDEADQAKELSTAAEHALIEAQRRLDVLEAGTRPEEIDAARARIEGLEARRAHLAEQARRLDVKSPVAGIVATPSRQLRTMDKQLVPRGGLILKVYDYRTVTAQITISEKEIADIRVGQRVALRARAYPNITFHGSVTAIAIGADQSAAPDPSVATPPLAASGGKTFIVTTRIDNSSLLLKPGMTGQAKVLCGERRILSLIGRRIARTLKVEVWSWW